MLDRNPHVWLAIKLRMFIELWEIKAMVVGNKSESSYEYVSYVYEIHK